MRLVVVYGGTKAEAICYWLRVYGVIRCTDGEALPEWVFFTEQQQQQRSWRGISTAQGIQQGGHICARAAENTEKEHVSSLQVREREKNLPIIEGGTAVHHFVSSFLPSSECVWRVLLTSLHLRPSLTIALTWIICATCLNTSSYTECKVLKPHKIYT